MKQPSRALRIIGGNWRSRKVTFPEVDAIRPTGDRIRETLFNWLMHDIPGSTCLDLFAGSGILGIEALSRGASKVIFVDKDKGSINSISDNLRNLGAEPKNYTLHSSDALTWLQQSNKTSEIVFVDPPFDNPDLLYAVLQSLGDGQVAKEWVYVKTSDPLQEEKLPVGWAIHREKRSGSVHYSLLHIQ